MAETEKKIEAIEADVQKEVVEATNPQADAPKKNAVAAEPTHLKNDAEDLGAAVVKPTDSNPDATKKINQVSGDPQQKSQGSADAMPKLKGESKESDKDSEDKEIKEGELPASLKKYLDKKDDKAKDEVKKESSHDSEKKDKEEMKEAEHDSEEKKKDKEEGYMKASYKKEEKEIDVKEHVDALVAGDESLSEEFKQKAATVFEAAIKSKVKDIAEEIEADYNKKFEEET